MLDKVTSHLELGSGNFEVVSEKTRPFLSILLFDFKRFKKEVVFFRTNFIGPDYFNFIETVADLESMLDLTIKQLKLHADSLNKTPITNLSDSIRFGLERSHKKVNADFEGIINIEVGLVSLIHSSRKVGLEAIKSEDYFIKSMIDQVIKELEKRHWVFSMFSKY